MTLLGILISIAASGQTLMEPKEFQEKMNEDLQLVDVRTPNEYEKGHLKGAANIDFYEEDFLEQMGKLDKEKVLMVYCRSGNRSATCHEKLQKMGFTNVIDLKGGIIAWKAAGLAVEK